MSKRTKGYRLTENGRYRAEIYENGRLTNLGTFREESAAAEAYKLASENRLRRSIMKHGYCVEDGILYRDDYTVFNDGSIFGPSGNKMRFSENSRGYLQCSINNRTEEIHRIIAKCFIPNPYNKPQVNHIDGNKKNNSVENLEWATPKENTRHAYDIGLARGNPKYGMSNGRSKLNPEKVKFIREQYRNPDNHYTMKDLAEMLDIGKNAIFNIIHNKTWTNIE